MLLLLLAAVAVLRFGLVLLCFPVPCRWLRCSHLLEISTIADGRRVRRLGNGGHCSPSTFPYSSLAVCCFYRLPLSPFSVSVWFCSFFLLRVAGCAALIIGHCRRSVSGCALSSLRLDCQLLPPLPVSEGAPCSVSLGAPFFLCFFSLLFYEILNH